MKKVFLSILALCGLAATDDGKPEFEPTQDQLDSIKAQIEKGNKAISDLATANSTISSLEAAKKTAEDALAAKNTEIEALKSEKQKAERDLADANERLAKLLPEDTAVKKETESGSGDASAITDDGFAHNVKADSILPKVRTKKS